MTQQQVAEWILDILVKDLWLKPGTPVPDHQLREKYRARKADSADQGGAEVRRGTRVVEVRPGASPNWAMRMLEVGRAAVSMWATAGSMDDVANRRRAM